MESAEQLVAAAAPAASTSAPPQLLLPPPAVQQPEAGAAAGAAGSTQAEAKAQAAQGECIQSCTEASAIGAKSVCAHTRTRGTACLYARACLSARARAHARPFTCVHPPSCVPVRPVLRRRASGAGGHVGLGGHTAVQAQQPHHGAGAAPAGDGAQGCGRVPFRAVHTPAGARMPHDCKPFPCRARQRGAPTALRWRACLQAWIDKWIRPKASGLVAPCAGLGTCGMRALAGARLPRRCCCAPFGHPWDTWSEDSPPCLCQH